MIKRIFFGFMYLLIGVTLIGILVPVLVLYLVPQEVWKTEIEKQATASLGRDVVLVGDVGFGLFPTPSARVNGIEIKNPNGFSEPYFATASQIRGYLKWSPLLSGRVEIGEFELRDAVISLETLESGETNFDFGGDLQPETTSPNSVGGVSAAVDSFKLVDARVSYSDRNNAQYFTAESVTLSGTLKETSGPLSASGKALTQGEALKFSLDIDDLSGLGTDAPTELLATFSIGEAEFDWSGGVVLADKITVDGKLKAKIKSLSSFLTFVYTLMPDVIPKELPPAALLGGLDFDTHVSGAVDALSLSKVSFNQAGAFNKVTGTGKIQLSETPQIELTYQISSDTAADLIPQLSIMEWDEKLSPKFKKLSTTGTLLSNRDGDLFAQINDLTIRGDGVNIDWQGRAQIPLAEEGNPQFEGMLKADIKNLPHFVSLVEMFDIAPDMIALLGDVGVTADMRLETGKQISTVDFTHRGKNLNADFAGVIDIDGAKILDGRINLNTDFLPQLSVALGYADALPGIQTLESSGNVKGGMSDLKFTDMKLSLDDIQANGDVTLTNISARPRITGSLATNALNLTRFLGEEEAKPGTSTEWDDTPFALGGLDGVDADISIQSPAVTLGETRLEELQSDITLQNGRLDVELKRAKSFGGNWSGKLNLNTQAPLPKLTYTLSGSNIAAKNLFETFAGLDQFEGVGKFNLSGDTSGNSLKALVSNLNGQMQTDLNDGAIRGVNIAQLVRSRESFTQAFVQGALNDMDFSSVLSPEAKTDFTSLVSELKIRNGVASLDAFQLQNPYLVLDADGEVDLINQSLDLKIVPRLDKSGGGQGKSLKLNGTPIPAQISGPWLAPTLSPDFGFIRAELQRDLQRRAVERLAPELSKNPVLGDIIGGVRGTSPAPPKGNDPTQNDEADTAPLARAERDIADNISTPEDAIRSIFGGIVRREIEKRQEKETASEADNR